MKHPAMHRTALDISSPEAERPYTRARAPAFCSSIAPACQSVVNDLTSLCLSVPIWKMQLLLPPKAVVRINGLVPEKSLGPCLVHSKYSLDVSKLLSPSNLSKHQTHLETLFNNKFPGPALEFAF